MPEESKQRAIQDKDVQGDCHRKAQELGSHLSQSCAVQVLDLWCQLGEENPLQVPCLLTLTWSCRAPTDGRPTTRILPHELPFTDTGGDYLSLVQVNVEEVRWKGVAPSLHAWQSTQYTSLLDMDTFIETVHCFTTRRLLIGHSTMEQTLSELSMS